LGAGPGLNVDLAIQDPRAYEMFIISLQT